MKRLLVMLIAAASVLIASAVAHSAAVSVNLRSESEVNSAKSVRISDIAAVEGPEQLARKVGDVTVGTGPLPGARRTVGTDYIKLRLKASDLAGVAKVSGPDSVTVVGKCLRITSEELADEAKTLILQQLQSGSHSYDATVERSPREMVLPDSGDAEVRPRLLTGAPRLGPNTVAIDLVSGGRVVATTSASIRVSAVADVLVSTGQIRQGEAISSGNTTWERRDVTRAPQAIVMPEGGMLQDWIARRTLAAGAVVTSSDVTLPPTVRQGDTVTLVVKCGRITLRTTAQVKENGRTGETVRVLSSVSDKNVRAQVVEPGLVEIRR